jgi:hypothetical protein
MITIGLAGKPNSGKSTFFKAATLADVAIANYPFTTIEPNVGIAHVKTECVCRQLDVECERCIEGWRFIPVELIDVAGLVPDAHKGRGLGNEFLDTLRQAEAIIHVVDASGSTDPDGNEVGIGTHDPLNDIEFLKKELTMWIYGLLKKHWERITRRIQLEKALPHRLISEQLLGAGISEYHAKSALMAIHKDISKYTDEDLRELSQVLMETSRKIVVAANKADIAPRDNINRLLDLGDHVVATSGVFEYALRMAAKNGFISYIPGEKDFKILKKLNDRQAEVLDKIKIFLDEFGSTGVQKVINKVVFEELSYIVVYPVEDENKYTDSNGQVLPDAFLLKEGATPRDLAAKVHTDLEKHFLYAVDAKTRMRVSEDYHLQHNDVIKIVATV